MGRLIVMEDGSTFKCELNISSYVPQQFQYSNHGPQYASHKSNEVIISIPYTNTNYQIINNHFKPKYNVVVTNYKKDLVYIVNDRSGYQIMGFFVTNLCVNSDYNGNQYIDIEGQCDYYQHEINLITDEYKRKMRKKKLERILND